jgi:hypothetical protein
MMPELLWHKTNLLTEVPDFGVGLPLGLQAPEFISQFLQTGYVQDGKNGAECFLLTPLDDLKGWLRGLPAGAGEELEDLREILLSLEIEARKQSGLDGEVFDLVDFELDQMDHDDTWETFEPEVIRRVLQVVLDQADEIAPYLERETGYPFFLSVGFALPKPDRHPWMKKDDILAALKAYPYLAKGLPDSQGVQASIHLDFVVKDRPVLARDAENGVVRVALEDARVGDRVSLQLSLAYPLAAEGYFLATFDAISSAMRLKS